MEDALQELQRPVGSCGSVEPIGFRVELIDLIGFRALGALALNGVY